MHSGGKSDESRVTDMRVLHCIPSMQGGGAERQVTYLAGALRTLGCDVHVALNAGGSNFDALREAGATIHLLNLRGNHDPRVILRLRRIISRVKPDVIQCWLTQMQIAGGMAAMIAGIPWVLSERASAAAYPRTFKNMLRARMGSAASAIVSNSAAGDRYWAARGSERTARYVIPNALPLQELAAVQPASPAETGVSPDEALVLFAGRFDEQKNAAAFVHAVRRVRASRPLRALMCGDGPLRADIEKLVVGLGLESTITVAAYTSQLWRLMKRADVFVSTSLFEGSPNAVLEAMALGCPLVVSDIPEHREILDERYAILACPHDPDALASGIESVMLDRETARRRAAAAAGGSYARAPLFVAGKYLEVYRDVLARRQRAPHRAAV